MECLVVNSGRVQGWDIPGWERSSTRSPVICAAPGAASDLVAVAIGRQVHVKHFQSKFEAEVSQDEEEPEVASLALSAHEIFAVTRAGRLVSSRLSDHASRTLHSDGTCDGVQYRHCVRTMTLAPVPWTISEPVAQVAAGHSFVVALTSSGQVWTGGSNLHGQLGRGHREDCAWGRVEALAETPIALVAAGGAHALAVSSAKRLFAWGAGLCLGL